MMATRPINLLFIVNSLGCGGAEKHVISLANQLSTARYRLSLAYLKNDEALLPQVDRNRLAAGVLRCNVTKKIDLAVARRLARHMKAEAIDLVVCVNTYSLLYGQLARAIARTGSRSAVLLHSTDLAGLRETLQLGFYRPLIRMTDQIVYVCENQRRHWRDRWLQARRDTVIHNGIDLDQFSSTSTAAAMAQAVATRERYGFRSGDYLIGLCATMRPEKAHGDLLQAVANLRSSGLKVCCLLIGDGPERGAVERRIDALGLRSQVVVTGFLQDVRPVIAACDTMAIVSRRVETFSIAALEAMAMGKPMIMSDIGGAAEQVVPGRTGYLFARGDLDGLAGAVRALSDRTHAATLGRQARIMVEQRFSLPVMVQSYDRLFDAMVHDRARREGSTHAA